MLRNSVQTPRLLAEISAAVKTGTGQVALFHKVSRFHEHLTYSKKGATHPKLPVVDPKLLKFGDPVSASLMLGDMAEVRKFEFDVESLNARGFLRYQKPYTPPKKAAEMILQICRDCLKSNDTDQKLVAIKLDDPRMKYEILTKAFEQFQHGVPNSMLHMMSTVGDLVHFYCTRINTSTPYEELIRNPDLPPNIHIQKEPLRFHPDTDTMFGGVTAFTKSSTVVTNIRAKKKYRGYETKMTWP